MLVVVGRVSYVKVSVTTHLARSPVRVHLDISSHLIMPPVSVLFTLSSCLRLILVIICSSGSKDRRSDHEVEDTGLIIKYFHSVCFSQMSANS